MTISKIQQLLSIEISHINQIISEHLQNKEQLITLIGEHLINAGGKKIRAIMSILTSKMFNSYSQDNLKLATAIEFIHAATLLHDDVVDDSLVRRFRPTANFIWGNKASILVGDFLLSQAFKLMVEARNITALESLSKAVSTLIEGEIKQLSMLEDAEIISKNKYEEIITAKTAKLFGSACEIGAIVANREAAVCQVLKEFGIITGKIFQITDDLLDYLGTKELIGKNPGDDFLEGKATLPIILLHEQVNIETQKILEQFIKKEERTYEDFVLVQQLLVEYNIKVQILDYLDKLKLEAYALVKQINVEEESYKTHLTALVEFSITRTY